MTRVPEGVLQWLHNSLKPHYHYIDRTYSDVVRALSNFGSLQPKTDVYTFDDGSAALLLQLHGTLPVRFRETEYRFPIALWVPHGYPREVPMLFVTPAQDLVVRPGQYVSTEGRVYHPYLAQWGSHWDKSSLSNLLQVAIEIFAREPPVLARRRQPPLGQQRNSSSPMMPQMQGPALPPKPNEATGNATTQIDINRSTAGKTLAFASSAPALPPKPGQQNRTPAVGSIMRPDHHYNSQSTANMRPDPPLPPQPPADRQGPSRVPYRADDKIQVLRPPSQYGVWQSSSAQTSRTQTQVPFPQPDYAAQSQQLAAQAPNSFQPRVQQFSTSNVAPSSAKKPIQDLMSAPLDVTIPSQSGGNAALPAPPIPPNPEKDALLHAISQSLVQQLRQITSHNLDAIPALEGQNAAMQQSYQALSSELQKLQTLDLMLSSNEKVLHDTIREADKMMENIKSKKMPKIDDVLVAPTVVGEQLYGLIADERAIGDAMLALTKAMDKGTVGADVYIKQTRSLAREQFFKKALIQKIGSGMGLSMDGM